MVRRLVCRPPGAGFKSNSGVPACVVSRYSGFLPHFRRLLWGEENGRLFFAPPLVRTQHSNEWVKPFALIHLAGRPSCHLPSTENDVNLRPIMAHRRCTHVSFACSSPQQLWSHFQSKASGQDGRPARWRSSNIFGLDLFVWRRRHVVHLCLFRPISGILQKKVPSWFAKITVDSKHMSRSVADCSSKLSLNWHVGHSPLKKKLASIAFVWIVGAKENWNFVHGTLDKNDVRLNSNLQTEFPPAWKLWFVGKCSAPKTSLYFRVAPQLMSCVCRLI